MILILVFSLARKEAMNKRNRGEGIRPVTKEELRMQLTALKEEVVTTVEERLESSFGKYRDELMTKLDNIVGQLQDMRDEMAAGSGDHRRLIDVEDRVEKLESLHPEGQHTSG